MKKVALQKNYQLFLGIAIILSVFSCQKEIGESDRQPGDF
jgi:hypothetical protein